MFESRGLDRDRRLSMNQLGAYRVFPEIKQSGLLLPCFKPHTRMVDNQPLPARTNTRTSLTQPTTAFLTKIIALFDWPPEGFDPKGSAKRARRLARVIRRSRGPIPTRQQHHYPPRRA